MPTSNSAMVEFEPTSFPVSSGCAQLLSHEGDSCSAVICAPARVLISPTTNSSDKIHHCYHQTGPKLDYIYVNCGHYFFLKNVYNSIIILFFRNAYIIFQLLTTIAYDTLILHTHNNYRILIFLG